MPLVMLNVFEKNSFHFTRAFKLEYIAINTRITNGHRFLSNKMSNKCLYWILSNALEQSNKDTITLLPFDR